jgi:hypothetical protein
LSKPAGIALQQANRPASSDRGKLRTFISYDRDDLNFADQCDAALDACGFECLLEHPGISGGMARPMCLQRHASSWYGAMMKDEFSSQ